MQAALTAAFLALAGGPAEARPAILVTVVDQSGHPVPSVVVLAADRAQIIGMALSASDGLARLPAPNPRFNFGVVSPRLRLHGVTPRGKGRYDLVVVPLPPPLEGPAGPSLITVQMAGAGVVRGRIVDQTGHGLRGVRVELTRPSGAAVSTVFSREDGSFAAPVPGGQFAVRVSAPGLTALDARSENGHLTVTMAVASELQSVTVIAGNTLTFRLSDSIDPEYTPPPSVRAWLAFSYGICPQSGPLKAHEKRDLKKYWYLDVLRREPPNPATISTISCTPAAAFDRLAAGEKDLEGFRTWEE